jgi:hypothetical protein
MPAPSEAKHLTTSTEALLDVDRVVVSPPSPGMVTIGPTELKNYTISGRLAPQQSAGEWIIV